MKINWSTPGKQQVQTLPEKKSGGKLNIDKFSVGHNRAELYIRLDETTIILPPAVGKRLCDDLQQAVKEWEEQHGRIPVSKGKKKGKPESVPKRVLKELYKSRKIGSKLISVNTSKKKHLPMKDD